MTGSDQTDQLRAKTKQFAIGILKLFGPLPKTPEISAIQTPLVKAATTLAANCRALARAWSEDDFHRNRNLASGDADDCVFWLELLAAAGTDRNTRTGSRACSPRTFPSSPTNRFLWIAGGVIRKPDGSGDEQIDRAQCR
jgi:four helix bundle protein